MLRRTGWASCASFAETTSRPECLGELICEERSDFKHFWQKNSDAMHPLFSSPEHFPKPFTPKCSGELRPFGRIVPMQFQNYFFSSPLLPVHFRSIVSPPPPSSPPSLPAPLFRSPRSPFPSHSTHLLTLPLPLPLFPPVSLLFSLAPPLPLPLLLSPSLYFTILLLSAHPPTVHPPYSKLLEDSPCSCYPTAHMLCSVFWPEGTLQPRQLSHLIKVL